MLQARETVQKINEARQAQEEDASDSSSQDEEDGPQVAGEAISAMHDVADLCQDNDSDGPSLEELVLSLNSDQVRVYSMVKSHLEHQIMHECGCCNCSELTPLHMFVSGVGGTKHETLYSLRNHNPYLAMFTVAAITKTNQGDNIGITSSTCRHCTLSNSIIMCAALYPIPILSPFLFLPSLYSLLFNSKNFLFSSTYNISQVKMYIPLLFQGFENL